jgi:hypothetical protein
MDRRKLLVFCCWFCVVLVRLILPQTAGEMQALSPNNTQQLNSSAEHWMIWDRLSMRFEMTLQQHEQTLTELSTKLEASEHNGTLLTSLCAKLSSQNDALKRYNQQIGKRMQERDEDLAAAYHTIGHLEKQQFKLIIIIVALGSLIVVGIMFLVMKHVK